MVSASFLLVICCPLSSRNCVIVVVFHSPDVCSLGACCSYQSLALIDGVDRELRKIMGEVRCYLPSVH
jgi:hypothetical protein